MMGVRDYIAQKKRAFQDYKDKRFDARLSSMKAKNEALEREVKRKEAYEKEEMRYEKLQAKAQSKKTSSSPSGFSVNTAFGSGSDDEFMRRQRSAIFGEPLHTSQPSKVQERKVKVTGKPELARDPDQELFDRQRKKIFGM